MKLKKYYLAKLIVFMPNTEFKHLNIHLQLNCVPEQTNENTITVCKKQAFETSNTKKKSCSVKNGKKGSPWILVERQSKAIESTLIASHWRIARNSGSLEIIACIRTSTRFDRTLKSQKKKINCTDRNEIAIAASGRM